MVVALAKALIFSTLFSAPASAPASSLPEYPQPDPAAPVDYIDWLNRTFGEGAGPNAADVYAQAYARIEPFESAWGPTTSSPWSDEPAVEHWLEENQPGLDLFRQAALMDRCFFKLDPDARAVAIHPPPHPRARLLLIRVPLVETPSHRHAVRGLMAGGYRAAGRGDYAELLDCAKIAIRAGRHYDSDVILMRRLVGMTSAAMGYDAARTALAKLDHTTAAKTYAEFRQIDPPIASFQRIILAERLAHLDLHQRFFKKLPDSTKWTLVPESAGSLAELFGLNSLLIRAKVLEIGYEKTVRDVNDYYDRVEAWMRLPDDIAPLDGDLRGEFLKTHSDNVLLTLLASYERARRTWLRVEAERRATHLVAALLSQDAKPDTLAELPGVTDEERTDPFTAKPFGYRRTGDGFLLYSFGMDRKDNGGDHEPLWGEQKPGDYVFWPIPAASDE